MCIFDFGFGVNCSFNIYHITVLKAWGVRACVFLYTETFYQSLKSPEVNRTQSNQHASQDCGLLSQHNGSIIIEPPVR